MAKTASWTSPQAVAITSCSQPVMIRINGGEWCTVDPKQPVSFHQGDVIEYRELDGKEVSAKMSLILRDPMAQN